MYKDKNRKDQYGNELLNKEAFRVGLGGMIQKVLYYVPIAESLRMNIIDFVREYAIDNVKNAALKAIEEKYYNEYEYDTPTEDLNEMLKILKIK